MNEKDIRQFLSPTANMKFTGERYVSSLRGPIQHAHHHRYLFAQPLCVGKSVLDLACGEGYGSELFSRVANSVTGVDIDAETIAFADQNYVRPNLRFVVGSVDALPFPDSSFDVVVSFETIEHVGNHESFLAEVFRVLHPDGVLIISSPNRVTYSEKANYQNPFHVKELDLNEFDDLLQSRFRHVEIFAQRTTNGSYILPKRADLQSIDVLSTQDGLSYDGGDTFTSPKYFVAIATNGQVKDMEGSILSNDTFVPKLQSECNYYSRKLEETQLEVADLKTAASNWKTELDAMRKQMDQLSAALKEIGASTASAIATAGEQMARFDQTQAELAATVEDMHRNLQAMENRAGARLNRFVTRFFYGIGVILLSLKTFLRYPTSRRRRSAYIESRLANESDGQFVAFAREAYWRRRRKRWKMKALRRHPLSSKKRKTWRLNHPYTGAPGPLSMPLDDQQRQVAPNKVLGANLHGRLFDRWVANAQGEYAVNEFVPLARTAPPAEQFDVKLIAYYLPQFHPIPENDRWWGKGFTEWRNVTRAYPHFEGHYQPRIPGELGYYDLRVVDVMRRQVELAKLYGISAFCFHFYWFSGKTLLETPIQNYLDNKDLDLPFCLCWANENWSRRWDGSEHEVLISQSYSPNDDEAFLHHIDKYFRDERYLKIDGRPVLTVYRPSILPDAAATVKRWRDLARKLGYPDLYLIATNSFDFSDYTKFGFDALSEFPPHNASAGNVQNQIEMSSFRTGWRVRRYEDFVKNESARAPAEGTVHPGVMMSWDNSARRPANGEIVHGCTPQLFRSWLQQSVSRARKNPENQHLVFINAWNEWAEGTYLEPDKRYGYAFLDTCASVIRDDVQKLSTPMEVHAGVLEWHTDARTVLVCAHSAGHQLSGGELSLLDALDAFVAAGFNIVVTLPTSVNADYIDKLRSCAHELRIFPYSQWTTDIEASFASVPAFLSVIGEVDADLVYVNTIVLRAPLEAARLSGRPCVVHAREIILQDTELQQQVGLSGEDITAILARSCNHIIANSHLTTRAFAGRNTPVTTIPNIVDLKKFDMENVSDDGVVRFGLLSNNLPKKGLDDVVELARACEATVPNARFLIIGPFWRPAAQEYISGRKSYPANVEFIEYMQDPKDAMARVNVVLNFSHFQESFGRTVLEGMAAGRPAIIYDWGALPELVEDQKCGFIVPYRDPKLAVKAVATLCNRETLATMSAAARKRARHLSDVTAYQEAMAGTLSDTLDANTEPTTPFDTVRDMCVARQNDLRADIIVCVHNALDDVKACLASVEKHRSADHTIILVDDGSSEETRLFLQDFSTTRDHVRLHRNEVAQGYTKSANMGLDLSTADFIVLLNSDTIVTRDWIEKMADAVASTPNAGIVGPMSNAASYQSLPRVHSSGAQTAINPLPQGFGPEEMNEWCESKAVLPLPHVPLVHGFCLGITREMLDVIGPFDEDAFPRGYGEENDLCLRATNAGFTMIVATNTFVYHAKTKSYKESVRSELADAAQKVLYQRHGERRFLNAVKLLQKQPALRSMREAAAVDFDRVP